MKTLHIISISTLLFAVLTIICFRTYDKQMCQLLDKNIEALAQNENDWDVQKVREAITTDYTQTVYFHYNANIDEIYIYSYKETTCIGIGNVPCKAGITDIDIKHGGFTNCTNKCR